MISEQKIWQSIEVEQKMYDSLGLTEIKDYEKFYLYSIITHSTAIEGSTLTEKDTMLLFEEGFTSKSRPLAEYLMNIDLKCAYEYAIEQVGKKTKLTPAFLQALNALVMKSTGSIHNVALGSFDSSKGEYRLCGVRAGYYGKSYMDCQKVPAKVEEFCMEINKRLDNQKSLQDIYNLSFDAHLNLATIHPWVDGNGRTSRLLMSYIQFYYGIVPTKIDKGDKNAYIQALVKSQEQKTPSPFRLFTAKQHVKTLRKEIKNHNINRNKGLTLMF